MDGTSPTPDPPPLTPWQRTLNTLQLKTYYTTKPAGLQWRSSTPYILFTIGVAMFTDLFLYGLLVPVLPFMLEDRVNVPESQTQSWTSGLLAVFAGSTVISAPISGLLADKVSTRQAPFLLGLVVMLGATGLLFLGTTIAILVLARVLQGVSSGLVWTLGLTLCMETVGPKRLGTAVGVVFSFISAGAIWGPFIGGLLYETVGYNGVIIASVAAILVDVILRVLMIEKKVAHRYETGDPRSQYRPDAGEVDGEANDEGEQQPLLPKDGEENNDQYKLPDEPSKLARIAPILPCLKNASLLVSLWLALVQAILIGSCDATITTVSRELFGFDSLKAGLLFLPFGLIDLVASPLAGWTVDRYGPKVVAVFSCIFNVPALILLRLPQEGGNDQAILYAILLGVLGIGISGIGSPCIVEAGAVVDKYHQHNRDFFGEAGPYAQLYGLNTMLFNLGLTIGPEIAGELKELIGYGNMNIVLAGISAVTAVLSFLYIGGPPRMRRKAES